MSDQAPPVEIVPVKPLCYRCLGPRGVSLLMPGEDRNHIFHDSGEITEDDRHRYERGGSQAPLGHAEEA